MSDRNEDHNQPDEGGLLRDEVSDEAVEVAASVATGGLPTIRMRHEGSQPISPSCRSCDAERAGEPHSRDDGLWPPMRSRPSKNVAIKDEGYLMVSSPKNEANSENSLPFFSENCTPRKCSMPT